MKVDMSPQAVTNRMIALDQLWELAIALKSSKIVINKSRIDDPKSINDIDVPSRVLDGKNITES